MIKKKTPQQSGYSRTYINILNAIHDKTTHNIILNGKKLKALPLDKEQDKDAHTHHFYSTSTGSPSQSN